MNRSRKGAITIPIEALMKIVLFLAILIPSAIWAGDKIFRLSDQAKADFEDLYKTANEISKEDIKSIDSVFLKMDGKTAIVFFKANDRGVSYITGFWSGEETGMSAEKQTPITIMKPDIEGKLLCLCRDFINIKSEKGAGTLDYSCGKKICYQVSYDVIFTITSTYCEGRNNPVDCIHEGAQRDQILTNFDIKGTDGGNPFQKRPQIFIKKLKEGTVEISDFPGGIEELELWK